MSFDKKSTYKQHYLISPFNGSFKIDLLCCTWCFCLTDCRFSTQGIDYTGHTSKTGRGYTCQRWYNYPADLFLDGKNNHNYCRNPMEDRGGGYSNQPWCFYGSSSYQWDYCTNIPICGENES